MLATAWRAVARHLQGRLRRSSLWPRRYPIVRQYDQVDCGPACLLSVLRHWGGNASLAHVRGLAHTDERGTTLLALRDAANALGMDARGATGEYDDLMSEAMPCVAHVHLEDGRHHFVVVYRIHAKGVLVGDPAVGLRRLSREEFCAIWARRAVLLLSPTARLHRSDPPHWFRWIARYFRREEVWLSQSVFLGIAYTGLGLLNALFVKWLIDGLIPSRAHAKILLAGAFLLAIQLVRAGTGLLRRRFMLELSKRVNVALADEFLTHIFRLPTRFFDTRKRGDITARIHDSANIQAAVLRMFGVSLIDAFVTIGSLAFIFVLAPPLGWLAVATLPFYAAMFVIVARRVRVQHNDVMRGYARLEAAYIDTLEGVETIRSFNAGPAFSGWNRLNFRDFQHRTVILGRTQAELSAVAELVGGILVIGALAYGGLLVTGEELRLGEMVAAYSLLAGTVPSTGRLVEAIVSLQGASVAAHRLQDLLLVAPEQSPPEPRPFPTLTHGLELRGARFAWPDGSVLFDRVDLSIPRGRLTALCGVNGSGKSTLVRILERKYSLSGGRLLVDRAPADRIDLEAYRRDVSVVPAEVKVFNTTLADNIVLGRTDRDLAFLERRIDELGFGWFPTRFHAGLATLIGEDGRTLSSGERQVVGLLRALLDRPQVLIVDEGLSAIDLPTAELVQRILTSYAADRAVLVISHDPGVLRLAETLYLLKDGSVEEVASLASVESAIVGAGAAGGAAVRHR